MRISDWISDVCSSDLTEETVVELRSKRAYLPPDAEDGTRILVDRLWPRGLSKEKLGDVAWVRDVAPSDALRKWFGHDPAKWDGFRKRYFAELDANPDRSEEHTSELQSLMRISYAVFCLKKKKK